MGTDVSHHSYSYLERRYSKKTRLQVFLLVTGLTAAFVVGLVAVQMSETDADRNARAEAEFSTGQRLARKNLIEQQQYYLSASCERGKAACEKAVEVVRKQNCQLYGEGCQRGGTNRRPVSFDEELDRLVQERMRNPR